MNSPRRVAASAVACLLVTLFAPASARAGKLEKPNIFERYEEELVREALFSAGLELDPNPQGKTIERIVIVANQMIGKRDLPLAGKVPWYWLNKIHWRTRDYIIAQELLFKVGQPLRMDLIEESGRNLRAMFILAVARIVITRGSTPDRVVVLVMTKDNWTLRANTNFGIDQARLDTFSASISESNLGGRNKTASIEVTLDPGRVGVGLGFLDPRIRGTRHQLRLLATVFVNRATSGIDGGYGALTLGRPLFSLRTQWGWQLDLSYLQDIARQFQGGQLRVITFGDELVPDVYARRVITGNLVGTRSFGVVDKLNLSFGFRVTSARYTLPDDVPESLSQAARDAYARILPRSESASGPFLSLSTYRASYVRLQNVHTYALSEDFRLGPAATFEARFADPVFGFNQRYLALAASYGATYFGRGNLFSFSFTGAARLQAGIIAGQSWVNQSFSAALREVTPRFGPFRLHVAGVVQVRRNDLSNARLSLGSDSGLRGFAPRAIVGNNLYRVNVELRTIAANLWTVHIGGVLFYDGGDAPARLTEAGWRHDAGIGIRILFPQWNHDVLRLDLAFPIERPEMGSYAPRFSVEFGQAF